MGSARRRVEVPVGVQLSVPEIVFPPVLKIRVIVSCPDDHLTASSRLPSEFGRSARCRAGGYPTIRAGIILSPVLKASLTSGPPQTIISLPLQTAE